MAPKAASKGPAAPKSRFRGVQYNNGGWRGSFTHGDKKNIRINNQPTEELACHTRDQAMYVLHGDAANIQLPALMTEELKAQLREKTLDQLLEELRKAVEGFSKGLSAYRGVNWDKATGKWRAQALAQGKKIALGRFFTQDQAAWAYDRFQVKQQGRGAKKINFPIENYIEDDGSPGPYAEPGSSPLEVAAEAAGVVVPPGEAAAVGGAAAVGSTPAVAAPTAAAAALAASSEQEAVAEAGTAQQQPRRQAMARVSALSAAAASEAQEEEKQEQQQQQGPPGSPGCEAGPSQPRPSIYHHPQLGSMPGYYAPDSDEEDGGSRGYGSGYDSWATDAGRPSLRDQEVLVNEEGEEVELYEGFFEDADGKQWYRNAEGCYWPCDDEGHVLLSDSDAEWEEEELREWVGEERWEAAKEDGGQALLREVNEEREEKRRAKLESRPFFNPDWGNDDIPLVKHGQQAKLARVVQRTIRKKLKERQQEEADAAARSVLGPDGDLNLERARELYLEEKEVFAERLANMTDPEEHDAYIVNMNFHRRMFEGPSSLSLFGSTAQEEEEEEAREEQELGAAVEECGLPAEYEPAERTKMLLEVFGQDVDIGSMLQVIHGSGATGSGQGGGGQEQQEQEQQEGPECSEKEGEGKDGGAGAEPPSKFQRLYQSPPRPQLLPPLLAGAAVMTPAQEAQWQRALTSPESLTEHLKGELKMLGDPIAMLRQMAGLQAALDTAEAKAQQANAAGTAAGITGTADGEAASVGIESGAALGVGVRVGVGASAGAAGTGRGAAAAAAAPAGEAVQPEDGIVSLEELSGSIGTYLSQFETRLNEAEKRATASMSAFEQERLCYEWELRVNQAIANKDFLWLHAVLGKDWETIVREERIFGPHRPPPALDDPLNEIQGALLGETPAGQQVEQLWSVNTQAARPEWLQEMWYFHGTDRHTQPLEGQPAKVEDASAEELQSLRTSASKGAGGSGGGGAIQL